ncbi:RNA-binding component of cleavage and polyadenylation factor [Malassezia caprae]|uniref:mRNA 3'-end-processing protein n=1 Tax=Malassezia caprae TaxID=1381934 RepID=A0AAF0E2X2_9BASI|nr:RNA-binding component of cleavage and polyadenylation factor [Malassezia caprae]
MSNVLALPVAYVPSHATTSLFSSLRQRRPPSEDDWAHNEFDFEPYVKRELQIRLESDDEVCPRFERYRRCELGGRCPLRHCVTPSPHVPALLGREGSRRTVCKHWLRSLCKKGDLCDYLHEYDLRRMPECRFYSTFGYCHSGDECLHVHIEPEVKRRRCERYDRGFCEMGPACPKKHVRRMACPYYLAGFCPLGPECNLGHIKALIPTPESRAATPLLTHRPLSMTEAFGGAPGIQEVPTDPRTGRAIVPAKDWAAAAELRKACVAASHDPQAQRREIMDVQCYKCGEFNHFANACPHAYRLGPRPPDRWRT